MTDVAMTRAPGVFIDVQPVDERLRPVRLDVAAFAGVTSRGPARQPVVDARWTDDVPIVEPDRPYRRTVPVLVTSWNEYEVLYGGLTGPGRLGAAVASFFDQGGDRAWILRIVHEHTGGGLDRPEDNGASTGTLDIGTTDGRPVDFHARNEGTWGDQLRLRLSFEARPIPFLGATAANIARTDLDAWAPVGSLIRCTTDDGTRSLHWVRDSRRESSSTGAPDRLLEFAAPLPTQLAEWDVIEGVVEVIDLDPNVDRTELHTGLGLSFEHPRWLAKELSLASALVWPGSGWAANGRLQVVDPRLPATGEVVFGGGVDHTANIEPGDFFGDDWVPGDLDSSDGIHSLAGLPEPALLVTPDLYEPVPLLSTPIPDDPGPSSTDFEPCITATRGAPASAPDRPLAGLELDPRIPAELAEIIDHQQRVVDFTSRTGRIVALLDVPPDLTDRQILTWRQHFTSSFAAAYHPWLTVPDAGGRRLRPLNPSAAAAGIIADRERRRGVPTGPANQLVVGVIDTVDHVSDPQHDRLHPAAINVFRRERDGVRLLGARTLSRTTDLRQLTVRRLITLLALTLERRLAWTVFEPNNRHLRDRVTILVTGLLRELFTAGAFAGATEAESFFVRADAELNPQRVIDAGQLIVEIGIAPSEPIEFIVVRLARLGDGTLSIDTTPGVGRR